MKYAIRSFVLPRRWRLKDLNALAFLKVIRALSAWIAFMRLVNVLGYQRDLNPLPDSPFFNKPDPAAINPPWLILFLKIVAQIRSRLVFWGRSKISQTVLREGLSLLMRAQSQSH